MNKRPIAIIAIFFIIGIVIAALLPLSIRFLHIFLTTLTFALLSFIFSNREKTSNIFLLLSIVSFGSLLCLNSDGFPEDHIPRFLGDEKLKSKIAGVIRSPALTRKPFHGKINSTYLFEMEAIKDKGEWRRVEGVAQIRIQTEKDYRYGDRLLVKGTIRNPKSETLNSKQTQNTKSQKSRFNYAEYLERQNIFALINTKEDNVTLLSRNYKSNPILRYTYLLREKLKNQIIEKIPLESGAFLRAILLGDRSELPRDTQAAFKNSGTMHILPVQCRAKHIYPS